MAFSLVAHTGASLGSNGGTTSAIDTTGASFLVVVVSNENNKTSTVTDSKSNTWHSVPLKTNTQQYAQIWYAFSSLSVGASHTFTVTSTAGANAACVAAFSGCTATVDPLNYATWQFATNGATVANIAFTPSSNNQLVIAGGMVNLSETTWTIDGGFTVTDAINFNTGVSYGCALAYLVQTTAASAGPTWTRTGTTTATFSTQLASFRPDGTFSSGTAGGAYAFC